MRPVLQQQRELVPQLAARTQLFGALLSSTPSDELTPGNAVAHGMRDSTVSMSVLRGLVSLVEQAGIVREALLRDAGLEHLDLEATDTRVGRAHLYRVCELALDLNGDSALGLRWAHSLTDRSFTPVSPLVAHSASLRQGLALLAQFSPLLTERGAYRFHELGDRALIHCVPLVGEPLRLQRFHAEMVVGTCWRILCSFRSDAQPEMVSFEYAAPAYHAEYTRFFRAPVCFDQPFTGFVFERSLLDRPSPQRDDDVRDALQAIAERRLLRITQRTPYALRVRDLILREGQQRTDMTTVARAFDMSVRSLRRRLDEEGTTFNDVLNDALAITARRLIQDQRLTIQEVAYQMGFSDASAFHRAFKRWTGTTPTACREELLK